MTDPQLAIMGIGLVGGFGQGKASLLEALRRGGGPNATVPVDTQAGPCVLPAYEADVSDIRRFVRGPDVRRMNRFAKIAVLAASLALEDAGWEVPLNRNDVGLVVASGYGASRSTFDFLDTMIDEDGQCPSPTRFSNSVHSSAASHLSIVLQTGGPCQTVSQFEMSPVSALLTAQQWLAEGRVEAVLFGAVDEICPVLCYCYERFFGQVAGPIEPFAWDRQTAVLAEGAAFMWLKRSAEREAPYGRIGPVSWTQSERFAARRDWALVLGADGHTCCAQDYRRLSQGAASRTAYSPLYGSLPGGQAFDIAIAALAAQEGLGPERIQSVKCDAQGNCGVVECYMG